MDVECVRWIAILAIVCLDIDGKADIGIKVVISGRRIVIYIELVVVSILDRVGPDLRRRIIVRDHPPCPVDDGSGEGKTVHHAIGCFCIIVTLIH